MANGEVSREVLGVSIDGSSDGHRNSGVTGGLNLKAGVVILCGLLVLHSCYESRASPFLGV